MPQKTRDAPPTRESTAELRAQIATSLRAARARTGLSQQQVVHLLAKLNLEITAAVLERWEASGLIHVDEAAHLAAAYGTTLDLLAGRRAFRQLPPALELPPADRSSW
jgi:ribosome-binding protein aMBF1 (putative translation factor)